MLRMSDERGNTCDRIGNTLCNILYVRGLTEKAVAVLPLPKR